MGTTTDITRSDALSGDQRAETDVWVQEFLRRIRKEKIRKPGPGQYVDYCQYSKTGWAVWTEDNTCTCKPAKAPSEAARVTAPPPTTDSEVA